MVQTPLVLRSAVRRDANDAPVLAALIASSADCLVSCDQDLKEQYSIETVAEFVQRL